MSDPAPVPVASGEIGTCSPRERWGTCCPFDPECEHSFLDIDALTRWMDRPIIDAEAAEIAGEFGYLR